MNNDIVKETNSAQNIFIRPARIEEAMIIAGFQKAMARETEHIDLDPDTLQRGVLSVFHDTSLGRYYVAEVYGKVVGCLMITREWSDWRNRFFWWIQSVFVLPEYRRMGVYRALYQHIRQLAENDESLAGIRLYMVKENVVASQVYTKMGMIGDRYRVFEWLKESTTK